MTSRIPLCRLVSLTALALSAAMWLGTAGASAGDCVKCAPALQVTKSGPSYVAQGATATYHYSVWNNTSGDITDVQVSDNLCSPVTKDSGQDGDVLPADETWNYTCSYVPAGDVGETVTNLASASANFVEGGEVGSNVATHSTTIVGLQVTKTVDKATADPFDTLNYTITVTNNGPDYMYFSGYVNDDQCYAVSDDDHTDGNYYDDLMPGETYTFACSHVYDPEEDGSSFTNEVCVTGNIHFLESVAAQSFVGGDNVVEKCASATTTLATHAVTGQVFEDMNADGARQGGEPALPGIVIYSDTNGNGVRDEGEPSSTSDGQGNYTISVPLGKSTIREDIASPFTCSFPAGCAYTVDLPINEAPPQQQNSRAIHSRAVDPGGLDFGDWRPVAISGIVVADNNGNGARDAGEPGMSGVVVYVDLNGNGAIDDGEPRTDSAADGAYFFGGLKPGSYIVRQTLPSGFTCTGPAGCNHSATLASNGAAAGRDFLDAPPPGQLVLPARIVPGRATIAGRSGCVASGFTARVRGTRIQRVMFFVDGAYKRALMKPTKGVFAYRVDVNSLSIGRHQVSARVTFATSSRTRNKTLRVSFQRCAAQLRAPQFTG
jgi:hypothetical protein